jgi:hypothetical protein
MLMSVSRGIVFEQQAQLSVLRALCRGAEDEGPSFSFFLSFFHSPPLKRKRETGFSPPFNTRRIDPPPSLARCPFSLSLVSWSWGGGGRRFSSLCAAEGNKPKANPSPVSQPSFFFITQEEKTFFILR